MHIALEAIFSIASGRALKKHHTIAPGRFGLVHGAVGTFEHKFQITLSGAKHDHANAGAAAVLNDHIGLTLMLQR